MPMPAPFTPQPRLVLFDLDDTLCDYRTARRTRTQHALEPWFTAADDLAAAVDLAMSYPTEGDEHFAAVLDSLGVDAPDATDVTRARFVEDRYRGLAMFDDSLEVVAAISEIANVGIITNGPTTIQRAKIDMFHLTAHFPVIVVSEEVGVWKPDPRIFAIALERSGHRPEDAIYVGDSIEHDIPGAHAAGMRSVWMTRRERAWTGGEPPDAVVASLQELLPLLGIRT
ncbi:MAG: HAD family hydrolase [Thermomicrobiales bacterium]|nr:HAD family hydrolase [Thermomicrobiales bacterium]